MDEATGELGGGEPGALDTWNFSITVAKAWEEAFFSTATPGTRQVALRSAMTFSPDRDGVFDVFLKLVRHGLGGTNLPGTQYVSWIHDADFIRAVEFLIATPSLSGPINLASPSPLPNRQFLRILRRAWGTRVGLPSTRWMLEIGTFLLRTESELVLKSRRVIPRRLHDAGFHVPLSDMGRGRRRFGRPLARERRMRTPPGLHGESRIKADLFSCPISLELIQTERAHGPSTTSAVVSRSSSGQPIRRSGERSPTRAMHTNGKKT